MTWTLLQGDARTLPSGAYLVEVIGGRVKGVINPRQGDPAESAKALIGMGVSDVTIRPYKATRRQIEAAASVFRAAGWEQWKLDDAVWLRRKGGITE